MSWFFVQRPDNSQYSRHSHVVVQVLKRASEGIFVPLTVGGGIRSFTDSNGTAYSALEVASEYFRHGPLAETES